MFEQDYLMRMLAEFMAAMRRSMDRAQGKHDQLGAAQALDAAVGASTDLEGSTLLSLSSDSIASLLQVSGTDPKLAGFMARSMLLASAYYRSSGEDALADLRHEQAHAVASAFGHELSEADIEPEALERFFEESGINQ